MIQRVVSKYRPLKFKTKEYYYLNSYLYDVSFGSKKLRYLETSAETFIEKDPSLH